MIGEGESVVFRGVVHGRSRPYPSGWPHIAMCTVLVRFSGLKEKEEIQSWEGDMEIQEELGGI